MGKSEAPIEDVAREIEAYLSDKYGVDAFLIGSVAIGLHIPGSRDLDFILPGEGEQLKRVREGLARDFTPSPLNDPDNDIQLFIGKVLGEEVHLASVVTPKAEERRYMIRLVNATLREDDRRKIVRKKTRLKKSWFFPTYRYQRFKRVTNRRLGLRFRTEKLPRTDETSDR